MIAIAIDVDTSLFVAGYLIVVSDEQLLQFKLVNAVLADKSNAASDEQLLQDKLVNAVLADKSKSVMLVSVQFKLVNAALADKSKSVMLV